MTERSIINTHDQLVAAGGGVAITPSRTVGREPRVSGWAIYRVNAAGKQVVTDKDAAWYDQGCKVFLFFSAPARETARVWALEQAQQWVAKQYGETGPWKRNVMRAYVPERIAKAFPLPRRDKVAP